MKALSHLRRWPRRNKTVVPDKHKKRVDPWRPKPRSTVPDAAVDRHGGGGGHGEDTTVSAWRPDQMAPPAGDKCAKRGRGIRRVDDTVLTPGKGALTKPEPSWIKLIVNFVVEALRAWRLWKKKEK